MLVGLYVMFGRFFARRWVRKRTFYAVTDRRVVAIAPSWPRGERVTSLWLGSYPPVEKHVARSGQGTLWIGSFPFGQRWIGESGWPGAGRSTGANAIVFADIPDAEEVYARIRRQISDLATAPTRPGA